MNLHRWYSTRGALGLGLAATLLLAPLGCGGDKGGTDEAVVLPSEPLASPAAGTPAAAPAAGEGSGAAAPAATALTSTAPAAVPVAGSAEGWGTLKGRVVFDGTPPEPKSIDTSLKNPEVCAKHPHKSERLLVDPETKGIKFALVYIPKPTRVNPEVKAEKHQAPVEFDQNECTFEPHVIAAMKGDKVVLKSSDPIQHNINAKLRVNSAYNQTLSGGAKTEFVPPAAERGPIEVVCDIHPWMRAYWLITDSPYYAVTDEKGNYEIKDAPAGPQKVVVWQEAANYVSAPSGDTVAIKANDTTNQDFKVLASKAKP